MTSAQKEKPLDIILRNSRANNNLKPSARFKDSKGGGGGVGGQPALERYFQLSHYLDGDLVKAPPSTSNDFISVFKVQVAVTQICLLRSGFVNLISQGKCQAAVEHCLINNLTLAHAHPRLLLL